MAVTWSDKAVDVAGVKLHLSRAGSGRPPLVLRAGEGLAPERPWLDLLARHSRVIAPWHSGYGKSGLPTWLSTVDDLAYLYLDLAAQLDLTGATLVGACFGGWIAAEMAVRDTRRFARLALVAPLGVKHGGVNDRDIAVAGAPGRLARGTGGGREPMGQGRGGSEGAARAFVSTMR